MVVNSVHSYDKLIRTEAYAGLGDLDGKIESLVGSTIVGAEYQYDHSLFQFDSGRIEPFCGGIHELSFGKIPKETAYEIETMLEIDHILGIGFVLEKELYALAGLIYHRHTGQGNRLAVQIFAQQAAVAIKRQRAERSLQKSEVLMKITEDLTGVGGWEKDILNGVFHLTPGCQQVHGLKTEIISEEELDETIHPDDLPLVKQAFNSAVEGSGSYHIQHRIIRADDHAIRTIKTRGITIKDENGKPVKMVGAIQDITEEFQLEREKEERRTYLETILKAVPDAVVTLDKDHHVIEWNPGAESLFHYSAEEAVGRHLDSLLAFNGSDIMNEARGYSRRVTSGIPFYLQETVRFTKEGEPINVLMSAAPIHIAGNIVGAVGVYADISELKKAEKNVIQLLDEKEQLIKEVHHRIKNHMNTMYSILSIQASYFKNPDVIAAFEDAKNRIRLMQSLYHKLYSGTNSNSMHLQPFIDELVRDLQTAYSTFEYLSIRTYIENIEVTAKQSLPIGIIVTELITNSLKYAFPNQEAGNIEVKIQRTDSRVLEIHIKDDGKGTPETTISEQDYGFGLTLVHGYARQFDGSVEMESGPGTSIKVTLELESI